MEVSLVRTMPETESVLRFFFVAFFLELSEYDDNIILNAHGLPMWAPNGLPGPSTVDDCAEFNWWVRGDGERYLIFVDGTPAGYTILCTRGSHIPKGVDYELLDFYIAPKYRRRGVGRIAARLALDLHQGSWVVYQLERNQPARAFWQAVISEYTGGNYENRDGGIEQRFRN
jgi:predicted acetyltransferase